MISYYYIVSRSLTYAQRTQAVLQRAGIYGTIVRSPGEISATGCSHSVRIAANRLQPALVALNRSGLSPTRIYLSREDGEFQEVSM